MRLYAQRLLDPDTAQDIVQGAFLELDRFLRKYPGGVDAGTAYAFLRRSAEHRYFDVMRLRRRPQLQLEDTAEFEDDWASALESRDPSEDPVASSELTSLVDQYREAAASLPPTLQAVLRLLEAGASTREIAGRLEISNGAAASRVQRARTELRRALAPVMEDAPSTQEAELPPSPGATHDAPPSVPRAVVLHGRIASGQGSEVMIEAGLVRGEVDTIAVVPLDAIPEEQRVFVRAGALLDWSLEQWTEPDGSLHAVSRFRLHEPAGFTDEQRQRLEDRAAAYSRRLQEWRRKAPGS